MAPGLKLTYFNSRGAAEAARFILKYGEIEFEDVRINHEDWPQLKESTPFGQLPMLERDGKKVNQSIAMTRYCGKLAKLGGDNDWEDLEIDAAAATFQDFFQKLRPIFYEQDEKKKNALKETAIKETCPYYLSRFEAIVQKGGHLALNKLTWVDFYFATILPSIELVVGKGAFADYPKLNGLIDMINKLPAIKKWIEIRPKTEF